MQAQGGHAINHERNLRQRERRKIDLMFGAEQVRYASSIEILLARKLGALPLNQFCRKCLEYSFEH
jgi:hypothetical protein